MNKHIGQKNEYYNHNDSLKRRKKIYWTVLLSILFIAFEYVSIFHGTRFRPYSVFAMFSSWIIVIVLFFLWVRLEKIINAPDFITKLKYLLIGSFKLILVLGPVIYLEFKGVFIVQDYQLEKHGVLTKGIITNVTKNTDSNNPTFYADFNFIADNVTKSGFSIIDENSYYTGDSIFVLYSSNDINLQRIKGKVNSRQ